MADLAFTSFEFNAADGTTPRSEPDRWSDWHNVLDFGADPTGATSSTAAIQAAIDWTASDQRGTIYFPPGTYKITSPGLSIYFGAGANQSIVLRGDGDASNLFGTFAGFMVDRYDPLWGEPSGIIVIEKLLLQNGSQDPTSGAIRLGNCNGAVVRDCYISGFTGIQFNQADLDPTYLSNNCSVVNCTFNTVVAQLSGTTAVVTGNGTTIINLDCSAWDCAVRMCGSGNVQFGGRMEVNNYSVIFGVDQLGNTSPAIGCSVFGATSESFLVTGFDLVHADGCTLENTGGSTFMGANYGLRLRSGVSNCTIQSFLMSGGFGTASCSIEDSSGAPGRGNTFINSVMNASGVSDWDMPTKARTAQFINCNNPVPSFLFANLPSGSDVVVGDEYLISNSNIATSAANFGATIAGGGANTVRGRWNGANWVIV